MKTNFKPVILVVLDGFGYREEKEGNAIAQANTPFFDKLWREYPHALLEASGSALGLPEGQIGSSEVGHTAIGSGKVIDQDLVRINKAIMHGEPINNPTIIKAAKHVLKNNSVLHLAGLLSHGGVHSHQSHLHALISTFKQLGVTKIVIHAFTDGRDVHPQSAHSYLEELENFIEQEKVGIIASIQGRYFAMDRDSNWDRIEKAEKAIFHCQGNVCGFRKPSEVIQELHQAGNYDEHFEPHIFQDAQGKAIGIEPNDAVFFFNFRPDRMRQIVSRVIAKSKDFNLFVASLTEYEPAFEISVAFSPITLETTLAQEISKAGLTQVHIAETEKYAHATYFFNGGKEQKHPGEEWVMVESRKDVSTHDQAPEMRAKEIINVAINLILRKQSRNSGFETNSRKKPSKERAVVELRRVPTEVSDTEVVQKFSRKTGFASLMGNDPDFLAINLANADMVGHTGNFDATKKAIEILDTELARLSEVVVKVGGVMVITADHGNAEQMNHVSGDKHTAHTNNPVPIFLIPPLFKLSGKSYKLVNGTLADVAPTILDLLGIEKHKSMSGHSLVLIKK